MTPNLDAGAWERLLATVFGRARDERGLLLLVDLPDAGRPDHPLWRDRRRLAVEWHAALRALLPKLALRDVALAVYPHVGSPNRDLPGEVLLVDHPEGDLLAASGRPVALADLLAEASVVLAPTELSATAPLKLAAKSLGFRGATLPGFRREMLPALLLDWEAVSARVEALGDRLEGAVAARLELGAAGTVHSLTLDLRYRRPHAMGGLIREPGTVSNLPSGETYIVPYEGERAGEPSRSRGVLPVELDGEVVLYGIEGNRATAILSTGPRSDAEREALAAEPAYGNVAELGLGVLHEWGIRPIGSILLDEKLGTHVAFGRSDHLGGATTAASFRDPAKVVHLDHVYLPECQPQVALRRLTLERPDGSFDVLLADAA